MPEAADESGCRSAAGQRSVPGTITSSVVNQPTPGAMPEVSNRRYDPDRLRCAVPLAGAATGHFMTPERFFPPGHRSAVPALDGRGVPVDLAGRCGPWDSAPQTEGRAARRPVIARRDLTSWSARSTSVFHNQWPDREPGHSKHIPERFADWRPGVPAYRRRFPSAQPWPESSSKV